MKPKAALTSIDKMGVYMKGLNRILIAGLIIFALISLQFGAVAAKPGKATDKGTGKEKAQILVKYKDSGSNKDAGVPDKGNGPKSDGRENFRERAKGTVRENVKDNVKNNIRNKLGLSRLETKRSIKSADVELLELDEKDDIHSAIRELKKDPNILYAQPNYKLDISTADDLRFVEQWGLSNTGQEVEGKTGRAGVDINALQAWDITMGSSTVLVGVLDTGIDINHPDLKDNIYVNPGEIPGNGTDDDNNGYIDDVNGYDFYNDYNTVFDSSTTDMHGTYIAGVIAARANSEGIRGVALNVKIVPLKFINGMSGYTCDLIEAIEYAHAMGIKIVNCSFGGNDDNPALKDAMESSGILFICAAGNRGADASVAPVYPACFDIPNIISVAAVDSKGMLMTSSSYGSKVHVAAPGENILSTLPENSYGYFSGTSVSASTVTGIAALLKSQNVNYTYSDILQRIKNNVVSCTSLQGKIATNGRVNAYAALLNTPPQPDNTPPSGGSSAGGGTTTTDDDSWYTMEQIALLKEQNHYGETGVNPATGNFSFTVNDMTMMSPGFVLNINRTYNSKSDKATAFGRGWTFGFEGGIEGENQVVVTLTNGRTSTFKKNNDNTYTANDSRDTFIKNADGTYALTTKDHFKYEFSADKKLVGMRDRNDNKVSITIESGKVTAITDAAGRLYSVEYNELGLIKKITDPMSRTVSYEYENSKLARAIDPAGAVMRYFYDDSGYLTEIKDHEQFMLGMVTYNHSIGENQHKVSQDWDIFGNSHTYAYDVTNKQTTVTDINGVRTVYWYDESYYTVKLQDAEGLFSYTEYELSENKNKYGEIKSKTDRYGNKTDYTRDTRGNVTKITNPDASIKEMTFDDRDNMTKEKDEMGKCTFYVYDGNNNLIKKAQPLNGTDVYEAGCDEAKFAVTSYNYFSDAERQQLGYKAKGLLKTMSDPEGNITAYAYDADGNTAAITDPEGKTTTYSYNQLGWKTSSVSPKQYRTEYSYDSNGFNEKIVQHGGETSRMVYDRMGRKIQEVSPNLYDPSKDDPSNHTYSGLEGYRYTYYGKGKLSTVTDTESYTKSFTYDKYGNVETETKPNGAVYIYQYDSVNRPIKTSFKEKADAVAVVLEDYSYAILGDKKTQKTQTRYLTETETAVTVSKYDYANRLIEQQNPDNTVVKTEYNTNGTVKTYTDANGSTTHYRYDGLNRLVERWTPFEGSGSSILYMYSKIEYDKAGLKTAEKTGKDKVALDALPSAYITKNFQYFKNAKLKLVTDSSGRRMEYLYDDDGNLSREAVYIDSSNANVTEYVNNYLGKPVEKKVYVRSGDIYSNDFNNNTELILLTTYTYDFNGNLKTVTSPEGITTTYGYDKMDTQTSVSQPGQDEYSNPVNIIRLTEYNWEGKPKTTNDANNNVTLFEYDQRGSLSKVTGANGYSSAYYYDRAGRKVAEVSPKNYNPDLALQEMNRSEFIYDKMGRLKQKIEKYIDPVTAQWVSFTAKAYSYDSNGNMTLEQDALGVEAVYGTQYTYNLAGKVTMVLDPASKDKSLNYTIQYEYDAAGRKTSEFDANQNETKYTYDDAGNITLVKMKKAGSGTEQAVKSLIYDYLGRVRTQLDGNGYTSAFEYNALGKLRKAEYPGDATIAPNILIYQYDRIGSIKTKQDTMGTIDLFSYDNQGRVLSQTQQKYDGTEAITTYAGYDRNGNKRFETDGNGNEKEFGYDAMNRLIYMDVTVTDINSSQRRQRTSYSYDANGNRTAETDWKGNEYAFTYDTISRLIEKKNPYGDFIERLEYNINSAQIKSIDALDNATQYFYDKSNRLLKTVDPEGHETNQTYDNAGNIETKKDGKSNNTTYKYDEFKRLASVTNAKTETTNYTYDMNGNMLTQTDGKGNVTTFEYNAANKAVKKIDHGGRTGTQGQYTYDLTKVESYTYYANGKLKSMKDRNGIDTIYSNDSHGRLISQSAGDESIAYAYDSNGNQTSITDSTGITTRSYDELGRVTSKTVPGIGTSSYLYDIIEGMAWGNAAELATDPYGNQTRKTYDRTGRMISVTADGAESVYEYYANGARKSVVYPDGSREDYTYYRDNLVKTLVNKKSDGSIIDSYSYTYDAAHNQTAKTDAKGTTTYSYDVLNRLQAVSEPGGKTTGYCYDAAGNRLTETVTANGVTTTTTYAYNSQNRLLATTVVTSGTTEITAYSYDSNGNMTIKTAEVLKPKVEGKSVSFTVSVSGESGNENSRETSFNQYNHFNQMVKTTMGGQTVDNSYNGEGYRVTKTVNGDTTKYLYEADKVILEVNSQGAPQARNVYGLNLVSRQVGAEKYYYMYNGHADVTALVYATGGIAATYYYDAFGNITETSGDVDNNITYAGYQYDEETGYYYLNARYYDPKIARFLSEDTYRGSANDPLSLNLYTYVLNNPIRYKDPTGHWEEGDENLSPEARDTIAEATYEYYQAENETDRAAAHDKAERARNSHDDLKDYDRSADHSKDNSSDWECRDKYGNMVAPFSPDIAYRPSNGVFADPTEEIARRAEEVRRAEEEAVREAQELRNTKGTGNSGGGSNQSDKLLGVFTVDGNRAYYDKGDIGGVPIYYGTGKVEGKSVVGWEPNWNGTKVKGGKDAQIFGVDVRGTAQVSAASTYGSGQLGNKYIGLVGQYEGNAGTAQVYGAATARIDGEAGLGLRGGAEAAFATGEVGGGFHIMGYGIVVGVEGTFAGAGAKAEIGVIDGSIKARAKASAGLGGGVWFQIGKVLD